MLPVTIGKCSAAQPFVADLSQLPHLFLSYSEESQFHDFLRRLSAGFRGLVQGERPRFAVASSGRESLLPSLELDQDQLTHTYISGDEAASNTSGREGFMQALARELQHRKNMLLKTKGGQLFAALCPPLLVVLHDVFELILSRKRSVGLTFTKLLLQGPDLNIHLLAASAGTYRNLLRQIVQVHPLTAGKFRKELGSDRFRFHTPLGAEMVLTAEDFIFFKGAGEADYHRLYPDHRRSTADDRGPLVFDLPVEAFKMQVQDHKEEFYDFAIS